MTYSFTNTVGLGLTSLNGVVALRDTVVEFSTADHFDVEIRRNSRLIECKQGELRCCHADSYRFNSRERAS